MAAIGREPLSPSAPQPLSPSATCPLSHSAVQQLNPAAQLLSRSAAQLELKPAAQLLSCSAAQLLGDHRVAVGDQKRSSWWPAWLQVGQSSSLLLFSVLIPFFLLSPGHMLAGAHFCCCLSSAIFLVASLSWSQVGQS